MPSIIRPFCYAFAVSSIMAVSSFGAACSELSRSTCDSQGICHYSASENYSHEAIYYPKNFRKAIEFTQPDRRPESCLALSGGGLRAAMSTIGLLSYITDRGLLSRTDIISAVSGSTWTIASLLTQARTQRKPVAAVLSKFVDPAGPLGAGIHIENYRLPKPYIIKQYVLNALNSSAGFRNFMSSLGHSELFYDSDIAELADIREDAIHLNFPFVIFGATVAIQSDSTATLGSPTPGGLRRMRLADGDVNVLDFQSDGSSLYLFQPPTLDYFDITPFSIGSPIHGYATTPEYLDLLIASTISSAGLDTVHPEGSLGFLDNAFLGLTDLSTRYRYDDVETSFPASSIWRIHHDGKSWSNFVNGKREKGLVRGDVDFLLTDGGHADKLGIVPLLWRQCRRVVALDMSEDPEILYMDVARLVRRWNDQPNSDVKGKLTWQVNDVRGGVLRLCPAADPDCHTPVTEVRLIKSFFKTCEDANVSKDVQMKFLCSFFDGADRANFPHDAVGMLSYDSDRTKAYITLGRSLAAHNAQSFDWMVDKVK